VVRRWPCQTLVIVRDRRDASHVGAACLSVVAVIMVGCGPLKALLAPLFATLDGCLGAMGGDVRWCLLVTARGHRPTSLCRVNHNRLVGGGVLGGDARRLLKCALEEVAMSVLAWALCVAFRQRTHATLASLVVSLRLNALALPP
jgi:hypothetical protein